MCTDLQLSDLQHERVRMQANDVQAAEVDREVHAIHAQGGQASCTARTLYTLTVALERDSISAKREQLAALKAQVGAIQSLMANVSGGVSVSGALIQLCFMCAHMPAPLPVLCARACTCIRTCNLCGCARHTRALCLLFCQILNSGVGCVCGTNNC